MHNHLPTLKSGTFYTMASGGLGFGLPAAVGVALARPAARVIALVGDGSAMYSIQALWSAVQLKLAMTFVILNNRRYAALQEFAPTFGFAAGAKLEGTDLGGLDFVAMARGMGVVDAVRVDRPEALRDALDAALRSDGAGAGRDRRRLNHRSERRHEDARPPVVALPSPFRSSLSLPASHRGSLSRRPGPTKPIRIVVGFPPGGAADQIARLVGQPLQEALGQPVVVENRTGAGGNVAGDAVAKSAPDGYTLLMSSGGMVSVNPHIYPKMAFDPAKDLTPVAAAARVSVYLVVRPEFPAKNVQEFLAYAKANPGKLSYGSPGNGSSPHLAGEMMNSQAGTSTRHIPYRGAAPALQDLLGGQIDFLMDPGIALPQVQAGKLKLLAVGGLQRTPLYPDVPTLDESGLKGFDADTLFGFYAPAATPRPVIERLNAEINRILATKPVVDRIGALGGATAPMTPSQFDAKARDDFQRFGAIIRERKIVGD